MAINCCNLIPVGSLFGCIDLRYVENKAAVTKGIAFTHSCIGQYWSHTTTTYTLGDCFDCEDNDWTNPHTLWLAQQHRKVPLFQSLLSWNPECYSYTHLHQQHLLALFVHVLDCVCMSQSRWVGGGNAYFIVWKKQQKLAMCSKRGWKNQSGT